MFAGRRCVRLRKDWLQTPKNGTLSLVLLHKAAPVLDAAIGPMDTVANVSLVHWDDVDKQVGRVVRLDGDAVVYTLPMDSK